MKTIIAVLWLTFLIGCVSSASKLNRVSLGMSKPEVIRAMGTPKSTSAGPGAEYLIYVFDASRVDGMSPEDYYVRLTDGKVQAYGRVRDLPNGRIPE
jgi:outer membrane protein assembly factor BamE (lipoprotein component of BamABCDE complex)